MKRHSGIGKPQGPASRTRSRKKRKLRPVQEVAATAASPPPKKGGGISRQKDHQVNSDQLLLDKDSTKHEKEDSRSTMPSKPWLPEKRVLELILDILQRKDTHEIFAEPVDPNEVEDYYEIIKDPMDFGTMRAKLHEGMYRNLEQFEHDVFLITKNAMHFNSSATIYFRQARAINELATKVFHILRTHPDSFELEFSESRRRSARKPQVEAGNSHPRVRPKIVRNVKSSSPMVDESPKTMPGPLSTSFNIRRRLPVRHGCSDFGTSLDATDHEVPCGAVDGRRSRHTEADRRCTYMPSVSLLDEDESTISTIFTNKKLEHVIQQDTGYRESLMLFVKDLGPVVQMIARRKLLGWSLAPKIHSSLISSRSHWGPSTLDTVITSSISQNFPDHFHGHPSAAENTSDRTDLQDVGKGEETCTGGKMGTTWQKLQDSSHTTVCFSDEVHKNQRSDTQLCSYSSLARAGDFNSSFAGFKYAGNKSTTMVDQAKLDMEEQPLEPAFEHSDSNSLTLKLKNSDVSSFGQIESSMSKLSSRHLGEDEQGEAAQGEVHVASSSSEAGQAISVDQLKPLAPRFIFDLPYLRARLGQTNSLGQDTFLQQGLGTEVTFFHK